MNLEFYKNQYETIAKMENDYKRDMAISRLMTEMERAFKISVMEFYNSEMTPEKEFYEYIANQRTI